MRNWLGFGFAFLIGFPGMAADFPREKMPDRVYAILRDAIDAHFAKEPENHGVALNREGLEELRDRLVFPVFDQLEFWHIRHWRDSSLMVYGWGVRNKPDSLQLLQGDWSGALLPIKKVAPVEPCDFGETLQTYEADLKECLKTLPTAREGLDYFQRHGTIPLIRHDREWVLWNLLGHGHASVSDLLFQYAYAAAYFEKPDMAKIFLSLLLSFEPTYLNGLYDRNASDVLGQGKSMLSGNTSFRDIYEYWLFAKKLYGASSKLGSVLDELLEAIEPQAMSEMESVGTKNVDPENLPLEKRIDYYIDQLQESCERPVTDPPFYNLMQKCGPLIQIGTPAVSALIEHLDDRRLTRTVYQKMGFTGRIYRVGEIVFACFNEILGFNTNLAYISSPSSDSFSGRKEFQQQMRTWWAMNQDRNPIEWYKEQFDFLPIQDRIRILKKIEGFDSQAVDAIVLLKLWATELEKGGEDKGTAALRQRIQDNAELPPIIKGLYLKAIQIFSPGDLPAIANELAARHDFSLLPKVREDLQRRFSRRDNVIEHTSYLARYGDVEDYRYFYQSVQQEIKEGFKSDSYKILSPVLSAVSSATSELTVPILALFLDRTEEIGGGANYGEGRFSSADETMNLLIQRTGHNEGYQRGDLVMVRNACIQRWQQWWEREGRRSFCEAHPEVLGVIGGE